MPDETSGGDGAHTAGAHLYGVWAAAADKTIARDIDATAAKFYGAAGKAPNSVLPFYVLTKGYDEATGRFSLFIGGEVPAEGLKAFVLPAGPCAVVPVRPKLGLLWGPAIGQAKQYVYAEWLPASGYAPANMEYERHTEASMGKNPYIELVFCLREKA